MIRSPRDPRYPASTRELREMLGLRPTGPLPSETFGPCEVQGYQVMIFERELIAGRASKVRKPHRIYAWCEHCQHWIPAGRLAQHERAFQREA